MAVKVRKLPRIIWLTVFVLLLLVRSLALFPRSFWTDEFVTMEIAARPLWSSVPESSILDYAMRDTGAGPLTYFLDGSLFWMAAPFQEGWVRIPPFIAGILTMVVLGWAMRPVLGHYGAMVAMILGGLCLTFLDAAGTIRGYSWTILLGLIQITVLFQRSWSLPLRAWAFAGGGILGILFNPIHIAFHMSLMVSAYFGSRRTRRIVTGPFYVTIVSLGLIAFIIFGYAGGVSGAHTGHQNLISLHLWWTKLLQWITHPIMTGFVGVWALLFIAGLGFLMHRSTLGVFPRVILMMAGFQILFAVGLAWIFFVHPRHTYGLAVTSVLLAAWFLGRLRTSFLHGLSPAFRQLTLLFAVLYLGVGITQAGLENRQPTRDWSGAYAWLASQVSGNHLVYTGSLSERPSLLFYGPYFGLSGFGAVNDFFRGIRCLSEERLHHGSGKSYVVSVDPVPLRDSSAARFQQIASFPGQRPVYVFELENPRDPALRSPDGYPGGAEPEPFVDLVIHRAQWLNLPSPVQTGTTISWVLEVENRGTKDSGPVWVELFPSRNGGLDLVRVASSYAGQVVPQIRAGERTSVTQEATAGRTFEGLFSIVAMINRSDLGGPAEPCWHSNRRVIEGGLVRHEYRRQDWADLKISRSIAMEVGRRELTLTGSVLNLGPEVARNVRIEAARGYLGLGDHFVLSDYYGGGLSIAELAPGELQDWSITVEIPRGTGWNKRPWKIAVEVDGVGNVPDPDRTNNHVLTPWNQEFDGIPSPY